MTAPARAETFVLWWASIYTRGIDNGPRRRRLAELTSDCFEQRHWGEAVGARPIAVAISLVARTLTGIPADLRWRQHQAATSQENGQQQRGMAMGQWMKTNWWVAIAAVLGSMLTVGGIGLPFEDRTLGSVVGGIVIAAHGIVMLAGIRIRRQNRMLGSTMMAIGTIPCFPFFWTIFLPVLGLAVLIPAALDAADAHAITQRAMPPA